MARFKLVFFIPCAHSTTVLNRLFDRFPKNVGRIGNYERCAFVQRGVGQFRPLPGSNPAIGTVSQVEYVEEDRVEVCITIPDGKTATIAEKQVGNVPTGVMRDGDESPGVGNVDILKETIVELKMAHPYEEVAYDVYRLEDI